MAQKGVKIGQLAGLETYSPLSYFKVVQRKSGMSAGRYEVFIIGPTGKRFRSKNELKAFFEKIGEKTLSAEDFDFSTYGNAKLQETTAGGETKVGSTLIRTHACIR